MNVQLTPKQQSELQKVQMEMVQDMFKRILKQCHSKCVSNFQDPQLSVEEMTCTDRCVKKYMDTQNKVNEKLQEITQQMAQQSQAAEQQRSGWF